jgi:hypothetical protein
VVLFGIHAELASIRYATNLERVRHSTNEPIRSEIIEEHDDSVSPREVVVRTEDRPAPNHGVLGLSQY